MPKKKEGRPSVADAISAVLAEGLPEDVDFNRLEMRIMVSGQVAYRLYPSDGSDYVGGVADASGSGV